MKELRIRITYVLICFFSFSSIANAQDIVLFQKGSPTNYHIIIPSNATQIEKESASILKKYLDYSSGCSFQILTDKTAPTKHEIVIGDNTNRKIIDKGRNVSNLNVDGFLIEMVNENLIFIGGKRKGLLYAVYSFLEKCLGYDMICNNELYQPVLQKVSLPPNFYDKENPSFNFRSTDFTSSGNSVSTTSSDSIYCDWNKMNYFFEGWVLFAHSFADLLPAEKYFKTHPEYYGLVNGKRMPDQPCLSNPDVLKIVVQELRSFLKKYPNIKKWSVSYNDNYALCSCELCKKKLAQLGQANRSDLLMDFVNKICDTFPDLTISTLAYLGTQFPPKAIKNLRPNFELIYCATNIDRANTISNVLNNNIDPVSGTKDFLNNFKGWKQLAKNIFLWDYTVNYSYSLAPYPNLFFLQGNMKYFKSLGVDELFEQGYGDFHGNLSDLRCYLTAKLMWNINLNVDSLIQHFCKQYYGAASDDMLKYIYYTDSCFRKSKAKYLIHNQSPADSHLNNYLNSVYFNDIYTMFDNALKKVKKQEKYLQRINNEKLCIDYTYLEINKIKNKKNIQTDQNTRRAIESKLNEFKSEFQKSGMYVNQQSFINNYFSSYFK